MNCEKPKRKFNYVGINPAYMALICNAATTIPTMFCPDEEQKKFFVSTTNNKHF